MRGVHLRTLDGVDDDSDGIGRPMPALSRGAQPVVVLRRHQHEIMPPVSRDLHRLPAGLILEYAELALEFEVGGASHWRYPSLATISITPQDLGRAAAGALTLSGGLGGSVRGILGVRARPAWAGPLPRRPGQTVAAMVKEEGVLFANGRKSESFPLSINNIEVHIALGMRGPIILQRYSVGDKSIDVSYPDYIPFHFRKVLLPQGFSTYLVVYWEEGDHDLIESAVSGGHRSEKPVYMALSAINKLLLAFSSVLTKSA